MIKYIIKKLCWLLLHVFYIFPVKKNRILFISYHGAQFSCNPKYLYLYLLKNKKEDFEFVWEFQNLDKKNCVPDAKVVKTDSIKSIFYEMTSAYIIDNAEFNWIVPLRKNQVLLETWHGGGAYKKVGLAANWNKFIYKEQLLKSKQISYYVSSSEKFTEVQSYSKNVDVSRFIKTGMPRNSFLLEADENKKIELLKKYNLPSEKKYVLYAPTYRGNAVFKTGNDTNTFTDLDYDRLIVNLNKKFGSDWKVLYRGHYYDSALKNKSDKVIDVTQFDDMQELLVISDVLITDYSSSMWDFSLTEKPGFLYMPDLDEYVRNRGEFYTNPSVWPFDFAKNNDELEKCILDFDNLKAIQKIKTHLDTFESYECKNSAEKILKIIGCLK